MQQNIELVSLTPRTILYRQDAAPKFIYFPRSGVVSLQHVLSNGATTEVASVGNEGIVGSSLMVDSQCAGTRAVVQSSGEAWAIPAAAMAAEYLRGGAFQFLVLRFTQALMTQIAHAAICTRHHRLEQQTCRWLLFAFDRVGGAPLLVTHETIAEALGVRREGITQALGRLQSQAGIVCSRGRIKLLDRGALEAISCECYSAVRSEYVRLLDLPQNSCTSWPSSVTEAASSRFLVPGSSIRSQVGPLAAPFKPLRRRSTPDEQFRQDDAAQVIEVKAEPANVKVSQYVSSLIDGEKAPEVVLNKQIAQFLSGIASPGLPISNVLLLEDKTDTREMLVYLLELAGHRVRSVGSIKHALREIRSAPCEVLISDISLPDGDGWELMRKLKRSGAETRGIAISGFGSPRDIKQSLKSGFKYHLVKPIDFDQLEALVRAELLPHAADGERVAKSATPDHV